jgi:hypothetical protein
MPKPTKENKLEQLSNEFPDLFLCVHQGKYLDYNIYDGWYDILYKLCQDLSNLEFSEYIHFCQIKEKFGSARFYIDFIVPEKFDHELYDLEFDLAYKLISEAENKTSKTCEYCGNPGTLVKEGGYWLKTKCQDCVKEKLSESNIDNFK